MSHQHPIGFDLLTNQSTPTPTPILPPPPLTFPPNRSAVAAAAVNTTPTGSGEDHKPHPHPPTSAKPVKPPAQCSFCGMTFKKLEHCQRHERTHTLARPYPCTVCLKTFARQDTLNRHLRLHSRSEDGSIQRPKKRTPKVSTSSSSSTTSSNVVTNHELPTINTPTLMCPNLSNHPPGSPYSFQASPQIRPRPARERGLSLSAIDEQSAYTSISPYQIPIGGPHRQSISLPPHYDQYPNLINAHNHTNSTDHLFSHSNNLNHHVTSSWVTPPPSLPSPPTPTSQSINPNSSPLPNPLSLSPPTPLDSTFLADLSSYSLAEHHLPATHLTLPLYPAEPTINALTRHCHHARDDQPPMSAPATCTTWGQLIQSGSNAYPNHQPLHPNGTTNGSNGGLLEPWAPTILRTEPNVDGNGLDWISNSSFDPHDHQYSNTSNAHHHPPEGGGRGRSASQPSGLYNPWSMVMFLSSHNGSGTDQPPTSSWDR